MAKTVTWAPTTAFAGWWAVAAVAVVLLLGPLSEAANASPCARYGEEMPRRLSKRQARMAVRCLVNRRRESHGLHGLGKSGRLRKAAQSHTSYMQSCGCFAHECPGEPSLLSRLQRVNYIVDGLRSWAYGENIAHGRGRRGTPKAIVRGWMHSPGHRDNILNPRFRQMGIGFSRGTPQKPGAGGSTITTDFGMRQH